MAMIYMCMAAGHEEVECLAAADVMRRCGLTVVLASMEEERLVTGSHNITILADELFDPERARQADLIYLPGGMPGTKNLQKNESLQEVLGYFAETEGKRLAAICAAPSVLGMNGLLKGRRATCYPGFEEQLLGAEVTGEAVVTDGRFSTGKGLGAALDLGLEIVRIYCGEEAAASCARAIQYR